MDIVQDSMMRLAEKYESRPSTEWPMLFQRILQNAIRDSYRRTKVRSLWVSLFSSFTKDGDEEIDPTDAFPSENASEVFVDPRKQLEKSQLLEIIEKEVEKLPGRQREAFLMRYWEDMDIAETAIAMGCTEGSVKTHCSRATHTLAAALKLKGIAL